MPSWFGQFGNLCGRHWVVAALAICLLASGCVQRRLTIRSNPPGALVYVDNYEIGTTPVSVNFTYYGTRQIRLVKDGYETLTVMQPVTPAWYQIPPADFVTENMLPGELRDHREFTYNLMPQVMVPTDQLLARAEQLRRNMPRTNAPGVLAAAAAAQAQAGQAGALPPSGVPTAPSTTPLLPQPALTQPAPLQPETVPAPAGVAPGAMQPSPYGGQPTYPLPPGSGR